MVGFAEEARAEHALKTPAAMTRTFAIVIRDGVRVRVPSAEVVPGDLVLLAVRGRRTREMAPPAS